MKRSPAAQKIFLGFIDFLMLNVAFWGTHWIKYQSFSLSRIHNQLLIVFWVLWVLVLLFSQKIATMQRGTRWEAIRIITKTNVLLIMLVPFSITSLRMMDASRIQAYVPCLVFYGLEVVGCLVFHRWFRRDSYTMPKLESARAKAQKASPILLTIGAVLLLISYLVAFKVRRHIIPNEDVYLDFILLLYAFWLVSAILTNKYDKANFQHYNLWLSANVKSTILMAGGVTILVFGTRFFSVTRLMIFGPILVYFLLESIFSYICFLYFRHGGNIRDIEDVREVAKITQSENDALQQETEEAPSAVSDPVEVKLNNALEFLSPKLFDFIKENIDLSSIDRKESVLLSTDDLFNVTSLDQGKLKLFINLHKLNDIRWFNQYFLSVYAKLARSGYLIGYAHTIEMQKNYFQAKYPQGIYQILFAMHFVWNRVVPKLPWTQKLYFALTKGRNRAVSIAEVFGRFYFCGFRIVAEKNMDNRLYFIAQKFKAPSLDRNPTYGPIIRLKRSGGANGLITVYKFRTMHPYSEYLQEYIYEKNNLQKGGKFKDDLRVTSWGKFLRKTWLDELPMLYNWIKGDLQLLGVRPLSKQYLGLYGDKLRELRARVKPGLIPPFYADLPKTLDEILESERRYIEAYLAHPLSTQCRYFCKCFFNIAIRKARSG